MENFSRRFKSTFASQKKIWQQFANSIGAEYVDTGIFKPTVLIKKFDWGEIKIDSYSKMKGRASVTYTRFQTECKNPKGLQFRVDRKTLLNSKAPKGLEKEITEYADFDRLYRLFVSEKRETKRLLNRRILNSIAGQQPFKDIRIDLEENNLLLRIAPLNKDLEQLKSLFKLVETLRNQIDSEF
jgi:hypothetical protein